MNDILKKEDIPTKISRPQYESLCEEWGVTPYPDSALGDYGDRYGEYWGLPYDATSDEQVAYLGEGETAEKCRAYGVERLLRQRRFFSIDEQVEPAVETTSGSGSVSGQLWEECPRCGNEPVYLPQHLCARCGQ